MAPDLQDAILRIRELPTLPSVLARILSTAADPESSAVELGGLMADDQSLTATLLKLVNSVHYGFEHRIESTARAIALLGFFEVRNLTLTATAFRGFERGSSNRDRLQLWRHAIGAATVTELTAKAARVPLLGCFEAGLLHDIGKVVLAVLYPVQFGKVIESARAEARRMADVETETFGMSHAEVGGILAEHWKLPAAIVQAIRHHHAPQEAGDDGRLAAITAVANYVTYDVGLGALIGGCPPEFPRTAAEKLGLAEGQCAEFSQKLAESREEIDAFVGILRDNT